MLFSVQALGMKGKKKINNQTTKKPKPPSCKVTERVKFHLSSKPLIYFKTNKQKVFCRQFKVIIQLTLTVWYFKPLVLADTLF